MDQSSVNQLRFFLKKTSSKQSSLVTEIRSRTLNTLQLCWKIKWNLKLIEQYNKIPSQTWYEFISLIRNLETEMKSIPWISFNGLGLKIILQMSNFALSLVAIEGGGKVWGWNAIRVAYVNCFILNKQ